MLLAERGAQAGVRPHRTADVEQVRVGRARNDECNDPKGAGHATPVPAAHAIHDMVEVLDDSAAKRLDVALGALGDLKERHEDGPGGIVFGEGRQALPNVLERRHHPSGGRSKLMDQRVGEDRAVDGGRRVLEDVAVHGERRDQGMPQDPGAQGVRLARRPQEVLEAIEQAAPAHAG